MVKYFLSNRCPNFRYCSADIFGFHPSPIVANPFAGATQATDKISANEDDNLMRLSPLPSPLFTLSRFCGGRSTFLSIVLRTRGGERICYHLPCFVPKRRDIASVTEEELHEVHSYLNDRPKECLGFLAPMEYYSNINLSYLGGGD